MMRWLAILFVAVVMTGCGGGGGSSAPATPTSPTNPTTPTTPATSATVTIGADGRVSPTTVTIQRGGRVTMINNHNVAHDMVSDPHPEHNECNELNEWGFLQPGQQRTSSNLNIARICGFHDHNRSTDTSLMGRIIIQ